MKQKLKGAHEWDWVSLRWRRVCGFKAGVGKYLKRKMNKRVRKDGKDECKNS